jgi:hypothetical protein
MKTIKIIIKHPDTDQPSLVDFTFAESIILAYYHVPYTERNEPTERIVVLTTVGTFHSPWSLNNEKIIEDCVKDNGLIISGSDKL